MFPEDAYVDGLKGEIVGTGADGTTYIVSGTIADFAFTGSSSTFVSFPSAIVIG